MHIRTFSTLTQKHHLEDMQEKQELHNEILAIIRSDDFKNYSHLQHTNHVLRKRKNLLATIKTHIPKYLDEKPFLVFTDTYFSYQAFWSKSMELIKKYKMVKADNSQTLVIFSLSENDYQKQYEQFNALPIDLGLTRLRKFYNQILAAQNSIIMCTSDNQALLSEIDTEFASIKEAQEKIEKNSLACTTPTGFGLTIFSEGGIGAAIGAIAGVAAPFILVAIIYCYVALVTMNPLLVLTGIFALIKLQYTPLLVMGSIGAGLGFIIGATSGSVHALDNKTDYLDKNSKLEEALDSIDPKIFDPQFQNVSSNPIEAAIVEMQSSPPTNNLHNDNNAPSLASSLQKNGLYRVATRPPLPSISEEPCLRPSVFFKK